MAGEWIKMRTNLWDDPRIARLCDLTDQSEAAVVGGLYWLWAMADEHTEDGILPGLTTKAIDRKTGVPGLGSALCDVGWLADHPEGVCIVGFEEHNGTSAKRRCTDAQAKAKKRKASEEDPEPVGEMSACDADKTQNDDGQKTVNCGAREEKRREEVNTTSSLRSEVAADAPASPRKRGARVVPDSFEVTPAMQAWARASHPGVDLQTQTAAFRDHEFKDSKTDWVKAWRNWIRRAELMPTARASPTETNYARQMRERVEEAAGQFAQAVAAKAPGIVKTPAPWELAIENGNRTPAIGMGGRDLHEVDDAVRARLPQPL